MRIAKGSALAGVAAALFALLLAPVLTGAGVAHAQTPPAAFYGAGLEAGDTVAAMIGDATCGTTDADASGGWAITVPEGGTCGAAAGETVTFTVNGAMANETVTWAAAWVPDDVALGITLTVGGDDDGDDAMDGGSMTPSTSTPAIVDTGNAGLASAPGGASPWLALGLGLMALAATAGARAATARRTD